MQEGQEQQLFLPTEYRYQEPKDKMAEVGLHQEDFNTESAKATIKRVEATQEKSISPQSPDEIELYITKDANSCPAGAKANRFVCMPLIDMKTNKAWRGSTQEFCRYVYCTVPVIPPP